MSLFVPALIVMSACRTPTDAVVTPDSNPPAEIIVPSTRCATNLGRFGGFDWQARTEARGGPGPNAWNACQAWLDTDGLHLRLDQVNGVWTSAEVWTTTPVGYGRLDLEVATPLHALDPNVVFGFFTYPGGTLDGQHEIDIEMARFGATSTTAPNLNYVVYPAAALKTKGQCTLVWDAPQAKSIHRFFWSPSSVVFQSFNTVNLTSASAPYRAWTFAPPSGFAISSGSWPLHINLWLYLGKAPLNGAPVEIVISRVTYSAGAASTSTPPTTCR